MSHFFGVQGDASIECAGWTRPCFRFSDFFPLFILNFFFGGGVLESTLPPQKKKKKKERHFLTFFLKGEFIVCAYCVFSYIYFVILGHGKQEENLQ